MTASRVEEEVGIIESRYGVIKTFRFALAGIMGFGVTEAVLAMGLLVLYGRLALPHASFSSLALLTLDVVSLVVGVSASFLINERITVNVSAATGQAGSKFDRFLKFQAVSGIGNAGIIVVQLGLFVTLAVSPLLGSVIGALATYPVVYFISIAYVWKAHQVR